MYSYHSSKSSQKKHSLDKIIHEQGMDGLEKDEGQLVEWIAQGTLVSFGGVFSGVHSIQVTPSQLIHQAAVWNALGHTIHGSLGGVREESMCEDEAVNWVVI